MSEITFKALKREKAGKGAARACRREGRIPAVIYGGKKDPVLVSLDPVELEKALNLYDFYKSEILVDIEGKTQKVVCQDVQFHPVSDMPIHVDFLRK
jgi:large subunit ribosomal protein L25